MQISLNNNPIDKLECFLHNKKEELSRVFWLMGKHKKVKCKICGDVLDSYGDVWSPMQCGWQHIGRYTWICHRCLEHRNFKKYIPMIDEDERKLWEEKMGSKEQVNE